MRLVLSLCALFVSACGGGASGTGVPCEGNTTRCEGSSYQVCVGGEFREQEVCGGTTICSPEIGCTGCDPSSPTTCVGSDVHLCGTDGTVGDLFQSCPDSCSQGACITQCGASGVDLVYLVDDSFNLYSFDPRKLGTAEDPYSLIGELDCPAGNSWPDWSGGDPATPFSMSVDRAGTAWVLYTSGEIFFVSTQDASCEAGWFVPGIEGYELFGMGFVSDAPGGSAETLFIAGGAADQDDIGNLAAVDPIARTVTTRGPLNPSFTPQFPPEMTGTGDAQLYGYYPGLNANVVLMDKFNGDEVESYMVPSVVGSIRAWAFAHWGGEYYIFITRNNGIAEIADVQKLNTNTGVTDTVLQDTGRIIVGAGVSTCAPTNPIE